jgi:PIN domain nuclease of toxin-antitoxin system
MKSQSGAGGRLSIDAKNIIADLQNQLVLSAASLWEIGFIRLMHACSALDNCRR